MAERTKVTGNSLRHAFREIIWPRRKLVAVGLFLVVLNRLSGLVLPYSTKYLVDDVLGQGQFDLLYPLLGGLLVAVIIQAASAYLLTLLLSVEAQHLIAQLRSQVQRHVLTLPVRFFDSMKTGELVSRIMDDVEGVRNLVGTGLVQLVGGTLTAIVAFTFLATIDFVMTLLVLVPLGLFTLVSTRAFQRLRPAFRERGKLRADVTGRLTEALGGIRVIKGFHAIEKEGEIFEAGVLGIFRNVKQTLTTTSTVTSPRHVFHRHRERAHYGVRWPADPSGVTDAGGSLPVHAFHGISGRAHRTDGQHRNPNDRGVRRPRSDRGAPLLAR